VGNWICRLVGAVAGADGLVMMNKAIYRVTYVGPPVIFQFDRIEQAQGLWSAMSVVQVGATLFYLSDDGFYLFNGNSVPIGVHKVNKYFLNDLDPAYWYRVTATADRKNNCVYWAYPGTGNTGGLPNKMMIYNYETQTWSNGEIDIEYLYNVLTATVTLDGLDSLYASLDAVPFSLDSGVWTASSEDVCAFNSAHRMSYFEGSALEATMESKEFMSPNGKRVFVTGIRPLVDGGSPTISLGYRATPGGTVTYTAASSVGSAGVCPQRKDSRFFRAKMVVPAGSTWTHAQGVEPYFKETGLR
jgi:hypothetical protein